MISTMHIYCDIHLLCTIFWQPLTHGNNVPNLHDLLLIFYSGQRNVFGKDFWSTGITFVLPMLDSVLQNRLVC